MKVSIFLSTILSYLMVYGHVRAEEVVQPEDFETQEDSGFIKNAFATGATNIKDAAADVYGDMKTDYNKALEYDFSNPISIDTFKQSEIGQRFENQLTSMEGSPTYEAFVTRAEGLGIRNPVTTAIELNQCYDSALGDEQAINDLYDNIKALDTGLTSTVNKAEKLSSTIQAITSEDQSALLLQLFTIYVDQQNNEEGSLSTSQVLSPECIDAFNKFTVSVDSAKAILNGEIVQCKNFNSDDVSLTLCTAEPSTILKTNPVDDQVQIYHNVSGYLNNNGPKLCNVTFYVHNLDEAIEYYPEWLPFYDDASPEGLPTESSTAIWALVPADTQEPTLPYLDVVNTFYVCDVPQGIPAPAIDAEDEQESVDSLMDDPTEVVGETKLGQDNFTKTSCFATVDCVREISSIVQDTCESYSKLLRSSCHSCNSATMKAAKQECKDAGCSLEHCDLAADLSSSASSLCTSLFVLGAAVASVLVSIFNM